MSGNVRAMRDDIRRLEEAATVTAEFDDASPLMRMSSRGLRQMRDSIERDIDIALRPQMRIVIEGVPVTGHEVRVDALSKLLASLQEAVSSIAQSLTGKATARSSLPTGLREDTALSLATVFPGSFGATLRGPVDRQVTQAQAIGQELLFDPDEHSTLLDTAVDTVLHIVALAAADDPDDGPIIDAVLPLGSRSFKHLKDLADAIVDEQMSASIEWTTVGGEPHQAMLSRRVAQRLDDVLQRNRISEHSTQITGHLGTVSDIRNRVEIVSDLDAQLIRANVAEEMVPNLGEYYSHRVMADVEVTTVRSTVTGAERSTFLVTALAILADAQQELPAPNDPAPGTMAD